VRYKNGVRRGSKYLDNLVRIIHVYKGTINLVIEHLEILLVLINRLSLPLVTILLKDSNLLKPYITIVIVSVSY
jgi:hypothetical protein